MRRVLFFVVANAFFLGLLSGQVALDTIYKLGGRKLIVDVQKVTTSFVTYQEEDDDETQTLERKHIQKIVYNTGKIEEFNKPVLIMIEEYQWEAVVLIEDPKEVEGLYERGRVDAESPPSSRSTKAAKRSCTIRLQKKAANMKANIVLVTHKEATGGYGELPGYYMEGIAYGFEPLEEVEEE